MRNWKYINGAEVGNSVSENSWEPMQAKKYYEEAKKSGDDKKIDEIKKAIDAEYYAAYKAYDELKQRQNDLQVNQDRPGRVPNLEKARSNYELWKIVKSTVGNSMNKTCNETMHEWSTSKPKNVGNYSKGQSLGESGGRKYVYGGEINGTHIVYVQPGGTSYTFSSEQEIKDWLRSSRIGNAKVINSDREFFKELADDAKKEEKKDEKEVDKLIGNRTVRTEEKNGWVAAYVNDHKIGHAKLVDVGSGWQANGNIRLGIPGKLAISGSFFEFYKEKPSADRVAQDLLRAWENKWGSNADAKAFIGNKEYSTDDFKRIKEEALRIADYMKYAHNQPDWGKIVDRYDQELKQIGNSIGGGVQSETVLTEAKDGSQYWVEKTSKSGQYAQYNLYYTIGQGKRHAGVFKDKEAAADAGRRIIGNSSSNEEYWKKQYIEAARKKGISEKEIQEFIKKIEKEGAKGVLSPIKNSKSDDKFAYVMREFDEGKLKTPDGKVVTDPAQAKAIAYSESKKTENGLARARNAMAKNKKVKNSAVREYKHSDGRVAQIDFNEDGSDADMSIYEGTREIEQRNFSTIRDAEQYVTSHGFRRI